MNIALFLQGFFVEGTSFYLADLQKTASVVGPQVEKEQLIFAAQGFRADGLRLILCTRLNGGVRIHHLTEGIKFAEKGLELFQTSKRAHDFAPRATDVRFGNSAGFATRKLHK
jgi:hypothetical protein